MPPALPPGQRAIEGFPRFGTHLQQPPPPVPATVTIEITGAVTEAKTADLANLPRRQQTADFHCVAGWSAVGLVWEGVPFADFYRVVIEPVARPGVTHLVFVGLDGYRVVCLLEDALGEDVLIADHLNGRPLDGDHGAPLRLVSPSQYGYVNAKHLCGIELHTSDPGENFGAALPILRRLMARPLFDRHPRGRVWHEERNRVVPNWLIRPVYRVAIPAIRALSARGRAMR